MEDMKLLYKHEYNHPKTILYFGGGYINGVDKPAMYFCPDCMKRMEKKEETFDEGIFECKEHGLFKVSFAFRQDSEEIVQYKDMPVTEREYIAYPMNYRFGRKSFSIFHKKNKKEDKLMGFVSCVSYFYNKKHDKLIGKPFYEKVVVNLNTGRSTAIHLKNAYASESNRLPFKMQNITSGNNGYRSVLTSDEMLLFEDVYRQIKGFPYDALTDSPMIMPGESSSESLPFGNVDKVTFVNCPYEKRGIKDLDWVTVSNRYPNFIYTYDEYKNEMKIMDTCFVPSRYLHPFLSDKFKAATPKELMDTEKYIRMMCEKFSVPTGKQLMKLFREDVSYLSTACYFAQYGKVRKADNFYKILTQLRKGSYINTKAYNAAFKLIAKYSENETIFANKMLNDSYLIGDIASSYEVIMQAAPELIEKSLFIGSLREIDMKISQLAQKLQFANVVLNYKDKEKKYELRDSNIQFLLPEDTNRLVDIGQKMGICVGSAYRDAAINKKCTIVYAVKDKKYVGCFEIRDNKLIQAKAKYNHLLQGDVANATKFWVKSRKIDASGSYDYINMDTDKHQYNGDYHHLELVDGEVIVRYA